MSAPLHPGHVNAFDAGFVGQVLDDVLESGARVYGITGPQGCGKSTLAAQLAGAAAGRGLRMAAVSIDDFYLDHDARQALARDVHPLLATRGPPGTHDVMLACDTLDALRAGKPAPLPRFDKLTDRRLPPAQWTVLDGVDLVVFEGWFLTTPPQARAELEDPVNALEREEDRDGRWRRWCNDALARDYPPLWQRIDRLLYLQPPGFEVVPGWRWDQEQALREADPGRRGMDRAGVDRFVSHFERVSRQAMRTLPAIAGLTVPLDAARRPLTERRS